MKFCKTLIALCLITSSVEATSISQLLRKGEMKGMTCSKPDSKGSFATTKCGPSECCPCVDCCPCPCPCAKEAKGCGSPCGNSSNDAVKAVEDVKDKIEKT